MHCITNTNITHTEPCGHYIIINLYVVYTSKYIYIYIYISIEAYL